MRTLFLAWRPRVRGDGSSSSPRSIASLPDAPDAERVILLINSWVQLTTVLNELARSMGQHDFYPFVMSRSVLRKLHFVQMVVTSEREASGTPARIAP